MIVDCAHYRDGSRQSDRPISLDDAGDAMSSERVVWLGMFEPAVRSSTKSGNRSVLHEIAVEDAKTFSPAPKVEEYETGVQLVILRTARYNMTRTRSIFGEISIFVGP